MAELTANDRRFVDEIKNGIPLQLRQNLEGAMTRHSCTAQTLIAKYNLPSGVGERIDFFMHPALSQDDAKRMRLLRDDYMTSVNAIVEKSEEVSRKLGIDSKNAGDPPMSPALRAASEITGTAVAQTCGAVSNASPKKSPPRLAMTF